MVAWLRCLLLVLRRCTNNGLHHLVREQDDHACTGMRFVSAREGV